MEKGTEQDHPRSAADAPLEYARPPRSPPLTPTRLLTDFAVGIACLTCGVAAWAFGGVIALIVFGTGRTHVEGIEGTVVAVVTLVCVVPTGALAFCFAGRHLVVRPWRAVRRARSAVG
ncbi:MAG TPA: hypothetical protein VF796_19600 [Humisphaera sp.]